MQSRKTMRVLARFSPAAAIVIPALLLGIGNTQASSAPIPAGNSHQVKRGEAIFQQRCIGCHNKQPDDTTPFGPPNLHTSFHRPAPLTKKEAVDIIANGKGTMPGWGKVLSKDDIDDVIAYLKTR